MYSSWVSPYVNRSVYGHTLICLHQETRRNPGKFQGHSKILRTPQGSPGCPGIFGVLPEYSLGYPGVSQSIVGSEVLSEAILGHLSSTSASFGVQLGTIWGHQITCIMIRVALAAHH